MKRSWFLFALVIAGIGASLALAQRLRSGGPGMGGRRLGAGQVSAGGYGVRPDRQGLPEWQVDKEFRHDVFTFVRIRYNSGYGYGGGPGGRGGYGGGNWAIDYPDSDLNFSYRLHQLTSLEVNPDGIIVDLTDPELFNYPFIYMLECGRLVFSEEEVKILRRYLLNGGFLMVDDFWGDVEWANFYREIKRVFPDREPTELPIDHPIFHCVFDLKAKPQIPSINHAMRGLTYEPEHGGDCQTVHFRGLFDDKGRMMAIICHNTDLGDGWEREGENEWFFHEFSEKKAYPMGINIVFYAMTH
jgi:hypothetical protein